MGIKCLSGDRIVIVTFILCNTCAFGDIFEEDSGDPYFFDLSKRAWNSGFTAGMGKRFDEVTKRIWPHLRLPNNFGKPIHEDQNTVPVLQSASKREIDPYEGVRGIWGKRHYEGPFKKKKAKMEEIRRWGKRSVPSLLRRLRSHDDKILRGMWGKRAEKEDKKYYVLAGGRGHHIFKPLGGFRQMDLLSKKMNPKRLMQFNGLSYW